MNGNNPVVMIFAREVNDGLTSLVKKVDQATAKYSDCRLGAFVVFCNDEEGLEQKLKDLVKNEKIKKTVLTIDNPAGPRGMKVSENADVTVVLYTKHKVKVNHAFRKGELKEAEIDKVLADVKQILPED
jgi:hypothetical protein